MNQRQVAAIGQRHLTARLVQRGTQLVGHWIEVHEEGTRSASGDTLNMFGKRRSAIGEPLAMESGRYRSAMAMQVFDPSSVGIGFDDAEVGIYGTKHELDPEVGRPTLRIAVGRLKAEVAG